MNFEKLSGGYWKVNSKKFAEKFEALKYATDTGQTVEFIFFDTVWNSFSKALLGKRSLNDLYKERAQQLRDEYDYLILYFSGGADSYNVLRSFIDNNIKLDEICTKWPMLAVDKQFYTPNATDTSAFNYLSEWDYAVKPVLDSLKQTHPEIKIEIIDWTKDYNPSVYSEELIKKVGPWNDVEMPMMVSYSPSENFLLDKGKRVASIYGIDKPMIGYHENKWFMSFADAAVGMGVASNNDAYNVEYFYWTPNMPEIAFEQAFVVCSYLEKQKNLLKYFYSSELVSRLGPTGAGKYNFITSRQIQDSITKDLIYNNWPGRFQASKPVYCDRADKHFWIFDRSEFYKHRESFIDLNSLALTQLDPVHYCVESDGIQYKNKIRGNFKTIRSKWHFVKLMELS